MIFRLEYFNISSSSLSTEDMKQFPYCSDYLLSRGFNNRQPSEAGMKEHAYFFGSCSVLVLDVQNIFCSRSVLVRANQQNFCSCSVLEQEHVREQVLEITNCSLT